MTLKVWNRLELMRLLNSKRTALVLSDLQRLKAACDEQARRRRFDPPHPEDSDAPDTAEWDAITHCLRETEELCKESKWKAALDKVQMINAHLESRLGVLCDWSSLAADLRNAIDVVLCAMIDGKFVQVDAKFSEYVNNDSLFDEPVRKAFPSAIDDIREAGNCIAIESGTAAVFHLMRAVEWGVRALAADLGVLDIPRKNANIPIEFSEWDKILDQLYPAVEKKIDAMPPSPQKQETQEFYFPLLLDIRSFKDAFRNHVMHTRKSYSPKAADDILDYVRRFMTLLSTRISE
jgi:hypothetical protein